VGELDIASNPSPGAAEIHRRALVVDACALAYVLQPPYAERMRQGGVDAAVVTAFIGADEDPRSHPELALTAVEAAAEQIESSGTLCLARSAGDLARAHHEGRIAVLLSFQNATPLGRDLHWLRLFHRLGVRVVQLAYFRRNLLADGCGEAANAGLSAWGREVIAEMNRLGLLIDLSHVGDRSVLEAIEASGDPVAFTHSNARALYPNVQNKTDEQLKRLADRGGVVGVSLFPGFLNRERRPTLQDVLAHIDYLVSLIGIDHVGLGLDFVEGWTQQEIERRKERARLLGEIAPYPVGLDSVSKLPALTEALLARGFSEEAVLRILGANFVRVFRQVFRG
jgi:membrane dipeptidase